VTKNPYEKYFPGFTNRMNEQFLKHATGVIHVGANSGQERDLYFRLNKSVIWIEAIPEIFLELEKNIAGYSNQRALCALVGDRSQNEVLFNVASNNSNSSSIYEFVNETYDGITMKSNLTLPMTRMAELLNSSDFSANNHLVLDVQGSELLVLKGMSEYLGLIQSMQVEVSTREIYKGGVSYYQLKDYLEFHGFMPLWEPRPDDHTNIIFCRKLMGNS
jgi:FkbM family methyltransferase